MWCKIKENAWFKTSVNVRITWMATVNVGTTWMAVVYSVFSGFYHYYVRLRNGNLGDSILKIGI